MRAAGAAILGAAVVGVAVLAASNSQAAEPAPNDVDFDVDAEVQLAMNYYANALTNPFMWNNGQLMSLEGLLMELGFQKEASNIEDMRDGLYGPEKPAPEPLPDINFIPASEIDAIADSFEADANA